MSFFKSNSIALATPMALAVAALMFFLLSVPSFVHAQMAPPAPPQDTIAPLPSQGGAPLEVMFHVTDRRCAPGLIIEGFWRVDFGDGKTHAFSGCPNGERIFNTYTNAGTYT